MIERYQTDSMSPNWSLGHKLELWKRVEVAHLESLSKLGLCPKSAATDLACAEISVVRFQEIEEVSRHEMAAFVSMLEEQLSDEHKPYIHKGLTSSDVLDTAFSLQVKGSVHVLLYSLMNLRVTLSSLQRELVGAKIIGRTHGMHAEPKDLSFTLLGWLEEIHRHCDRLSHLRFYGKTSGTVGVANKSAERLTLQSLGLSESRYATQVVSRDSYAEVICVLAQLAASLQRFATNLRLLHQTEIGEVQENFAAGQKGSSAMPHKKNPIACENITGVCRTIMGYVGPALNNVVLWNERDMSHSSSERIIFPDAFGLTHYAVIKMTQTLKGMKFNTDKMLENIESTKHMTDSHNELLRLVETGMSREDAYHEVQKKFMK